MAVIAPTFTGFRPEAIQFLADLAANNERAWFQPRKAEYEALLKEPMEAALRRAGGASSVAADIPLHADPARSPFRIYRDTRFSKDKSPYKTHVAASFALGRRRRRGTGRSHTDNVHARGGYFHLQPGDIYVGGGVWHPGAVVAEGVPGSCRQPDRRVSGHCRGAQFSRRSARSAMTASL